jgi:hypothetical protein
MSGRGVRVVSARLLKKNLLTQFLISVIYTFSFLLKTKTSLDPFPYFSDSIFIMFYLNLS